jgi:hypothetical protein
VILLLLTLFGLTVAFLPRVQERERAARGADRLQGWLLIAKQRALRDRTPTGLRLIIDSANPNWVRDLEYVQQPDDYSGGTFLRYDTVGSELFAEFSGVDFTGGLGFGPGAPDLAPVQPGDYLEVFGGGLVHQIIGVVGQTRLKLNFRTVVTNSPTSNYRIIRQPRRLAGEQPLQMPEKVVIDRSPYPTPTSPTLSQNLPVRTVFGTSTSFIEILFAPSGSVVGQGTGSDRIVLWVRDTSQTDPRLGEPRLITVYVRTGFIAAHPIDISGPDFYTFTRDGRSSGL